MTRQKRGRFASRASVLIRKAGREPEAAFIWTDPAAGRPLSNESTRVLENSDSAMVRAIAFRDTGLGFYFRDASKQLRSYVRLIERVFHVEHFQ